MTIKHLIKSRDFIFGHEKTTAKLNYLRQFFHHQKNNLEKGERFDKHYVNIGTLLSISSKFHPSTLSTTSKLPQSNARFVLCMLKKGHIHIRIYTLYTHSLGRIFYHMAL